MPTWMCLHSTTQVISFFRCQSCNWMKVLLVWASSLQQCWTNCEAGEMLKAKFGVSSNFNLDPYSAQMEPSTIVRSWASTTPTE